MKLLGKVSSTLISENLGTDLKLRTQYYMMILPQNLLQQFGINSQEISFDLAVDDSDKLTLIGPKLGSQPKSVTSDPERGGFVI